MPLRNITLLCPPIIEFLRDGRRHSWEIEDELARQFNITADERAQVHLNCGVSVWTNDMAFALKRLREDRIIDCELRKRRAPNGGYRGAYYLTSIG
jgi:hypothetical protein